MLTKATSFHTKQNHDFDTFFSFMVNESALVSRCLSSVRQEFQDISIQIEYHGQSSEEFAARLDASLHEELPLKLSEPLKLVLGKNLPFKFLEFTRSHTIGLVWFSLKLHNTDIEPVINFDDVEGFDVDTFTLPLIFSSRGCLSCSANNVWDLILVGSYCTVLFDDAAVAELKASFTHSFSKIAIDIETKKLTDAEDAIDEVLRREARGRPAGNRDLDKDFLEKVIESVSLFQTYCKAEIEMIAGAFESIAVKAEETIVKQGEMGKHFYIIQSGSADVFLESENGRKVSKKRTLGAGEYFGELALNFDAPRNATIVASTDSVLWRIDKTTMHGQVLQAVLSEEESIGKWDYEDAF